LRKILFVCPTSWDAKQLDSCRPAWEGRFEPLFAGPTDEERAWDFDPVAFVEEAVRSHAGRIDAVTSSSDYPGATLAAEIARRLGLHGPSPESVVRSSHKYYSRLGQRESAPDATPAFCLIDPSKPAPADLEIGYPCFVKPVKGAFSILSRRVDSPAELQSFLERPAVAEFFGPYMRTFNEIVEHVARLPIGGGFLLAEELLRGRQVTVEGLATADAVHVFGIVDSVIHPRTGSFERFEYPSGLPAGVQRRMQSVAERVIEGIGLREALFNIEMIYDEETDAIRIIEVNPRISGQFGDLYSKVDGFNSYEALMAVAAGEEPRLASRQGPFAAAASVPLRLYEPVLVRKAPEEEEILRVEKAFPSALVWSEVRAGWRLADFEHLEDGRSVRYAVVNAGGASAEAAVETAGRIREMLGYEFEPL